MPSDDLQERLRRAKSGIDFAQETVPQLVKLGIKHRKAVQIVFEEFLGLKLDDEDVQDPPEPIQTQPLKAVS